MTGYPIGKAAAMGCLAAMCWQSQAVAGSCGLGYVTELPITYSQNRITVPVEINGKTVMLLLDTGAQNSFVSRATAHAVGLRIDDRTGTRLPENLAFGVGGRRVEFPGVAHQIALGGFPGHELKIEVQSTEANVTHGTNFDVLGMNLLGPFDLDIDLPGKRLVLYYASTPCAQPVVPLGGNLYQADLIAGDLTDGRAYTTIVMNGVALRALVDTGAQGSVISQAAAERAGVTATDLARAPVISAEGIGGRISGRRYVFASGALGDITVAHMAATIIPDGGHDWDVIVGMDVISKMHLWISKSSRTLVMQVPPEASAPVAMARAPGVRALGQVDGDGRREIKTASHVSANAMMED